MSGLNPLEITGWRVGQVFVGQLGIGPFPFEIFGPVWPAMGVRPGPKVPTTTYLYSLFITQLKGDIIKSFLHFEPPL